MGKGILSIDLRALAAALCLPEGYRVVAVQQDQCSFTVSLLIEATAIPETEEGESFPLLSATHHVEVLPDQDPAYRKVSASITVVPKARSVVGISPLALPARRLQKRNIP